jgi:two-component system, OmpR family, phosphate regulon sensor histidine kinase PhoR
MTWRPSFQIKLYLVALAAAALALAVAGMLFAATMRRQTEVRIEQTLTAEARLAAELLRQGALATETPAALDAEADRIGQLVSARITFIAGDGEVVGDSAEPIEALATLENHATRPEVVEAGRSGTGQARRYSATIGTDMLYVAVSVTHPAIAFVRVALPLSDVDLQLRTVVVATLTALGVALVGAAAIAFVLSRRIGRRVHAIAEVADRYRSGDLTPSGLDFGDDELGVVARALDTSVQQLSGRLDELSRDRARMDAMLAGMVEGVIVIDPAGRVQRANGAARSMLNLEELPLERPYVEAIRHPAVRELVSAALEGRAASSVELAWSAWSADDARVIMARAAPVTSADRHGAVLVLHDITDLKRADRVRRDFVANVSHELRTPLTAIRGYVEALLEPDTSHDDSRRFLEVLLRHTLRMDRLVTDLLRLARLDAGHEVIDTTRCDIEAVLQTVVADLRPALEVRRQQVTATLAPDAQAVLADSAKLQDALRNLVANASTYTPEGTEIRVTTSRAGETSVAIAIEDEGPGIPEDDLQRVFERFYRVDKSRARDPGGTGLGLSIVKHLVELHGGSVRAENLERGGARFVVTLPAA